MTTFNGMGLHFAKPNPTRPHKLPRVLRSRRMVKCVVSAELPCPSDAAFDLLHDYDRRLEWDTLLSEAYLCDGATRADVGVVSVCRGRLGVGGFAMKTVYVSFRRPEVAAVKLLHPTAVFESWAASIRHQDLGDRRSKITYTLSFSARPRSMARWLEPSLERIFRWETRRRLIALGAFLSTADGVAGSSKPPL